MGHRGYNAIQKLRDTAYQGVCATYWSATGQVHGYLKRYRDWLSTTWIPSWIKTDEARLAQYAIMNTPAASWKSTIPQETAIKYLETARGTVCPAPDASRAARAKGCN